MATKKELLEKLDKIDDEELAHMLALVAYRENQEELDQLLQSEEYTPPDEAEMRTFQEKFHKDSQRALHRSKSRMIRWACGVAAAAVFAFAVPISADNVTIFELVAQVFTDYSDISTLDGYTFVKPENWKYSYYPKWIPSAFSSSQVVSASYSQSIYFTSMSGASFSFSCTAEWISDYSSVGEEQFEMSMISLHGKEYPIFSSENGKIKILQIKANDCTIIIDGEITQQQIVKIAENIEGLK